MNHVDTTNWKRKKGLVQRALATSIGRAVLEASQDVYLEAGKNLSGPHVDVKAKKGSDPNIGKMPVPRRTGNLARALNNVPLSISLSAIFTDTNEANYDKFVHDGTRHTEPRRYLADAVTKNKQKIFNKFDKEIKSDIHKVGR